MAAQSGTPDEVVRIDFEFRRTLAEKIEGNLVSYCYQCGACVGDCPATTYGEGFNPRRIMLSILYGLGEQYMSPDSILWQCTNCYNCAERCPQQVKPAEVIIAMKNLMADRGIYPAGVDRVIKTFLEHGRTVAPSPVIDKNREKFGLPPLAPVPMEEIRTLLGLAEKEPDVEPEGKGGEA
jgi:heterodisulfide reductase subunit C